MEERATSLAMVGPSMVALKREREREREEEEEIGEVNEVCGKRRRVEK